ncbi:MAG: hypothetical protein GVY17_06395 [Cyanobacteria bacterium]|jgi:hypothetical protein|nr:hypothetical protein [Cyanobacteria bacterium GSL.Bin21]
MEKIAPSPIADSTFEAKIKKTEISRITAVTFTSPPVASGQAAYSQITQD